MTVRVLGLESGVTSLEDHRHLVSLFMAATESAALQRRQGIVPEAGPGEGDLSTASAMQADIDSFIAWVDGTSTSIQGGYPFVSDAVETLTFSDGDATNDRIDLVVAQIRDDTYDGSGNTDGRVVIVEGTAASSPSVPATPASSIPMYEVLVEAGTSAGSGGIDFGANVTDVREYTATLGGVLVTTSGTASQSDWPAMPYAGQMIFDRSDDALYVYNGSWFLVWVEPVLPDSDYTTLTDDSPSSASTFEQWGTETIEFDNPGVAVKVAAWGVGEADNTTEVADVSMRLQISLDGGSTWTSGERSRGNVGPDGADNRENISAIHHRSGTPTGSVVVRAQLLSGSTDSGFASGSIMATIMRSV